MKIRMEFEIRVACDIIDGEDLVVRDLGEIATLMVVTMEVACDGCHGSLQEQLHGDMMTLDNLYGGGGVREDSGTLTPSSSLTAFPRHRFSVQAKISKIFIPALSFTMTEGKIVSWIKSKGDKLSKGESVVVPESDKADMDVETFYDDILAAIVKSDGEIASVVVATPYVIAPETTASPPPPAKSVSDGPRKTVAMPQANKVAKEQKKGFFSPSFFNIERYEDRDRNILGRR
ncbi:dihydrolipoyllysine-residue acetyltransferase component 4 of pyruvate dehydrogenase complex, chloroplastic-like [Vigna umbellata]|uniref:dihydrolipoyllysine-residue acetyltransferase component 4 of pyruvate dehydrogenase complex, chloroplastic-like n=1 Tax=Vigna umbellata TaxID=87088 RepID=UPI001F5E7E06|nr:dihydrolipoyllysine-residue acetyltransferase component 4 of pyruvate dehydrogenase complex, chloroplastic-like [Vigna umbellata]